MGTVHSLIEKRKVRLGDLGDGLKVTIYDKIAKSSWEIQMPMMRVVHWKDPNLNVAEVLVASMAVVDDEDPTQMGTNFNMADCLVRDPSNEETSVHSYYLRPQFLDTFNEGLKEIGCRTASPGSTVLIQATQIFTMWFDRLATIQGMDYSINTASSTDLEPLQS